MGTTLVVILLYSSRPARVIKPRRTEDPPRVAAAAARRPVVPASSQQQKPARRGDVAKPPGVGASKKYSPSVAPAGPGARPKGGKSVKVFSKMCMCFVDHVVMVRTLIHTESFHKVCKLRSIRKIFPCC